MPTPDSGQPTPSTIGSSHIDHETALSMAKSIRRAEVALLGDDTDGISTALQMELSRAHATLVPRPTAATRFVIPTPTATEDEILAAAEQGALLVQASDVSALVDAYQAVWFPESLQEAARRAREDARKLALMKAFSVKVNADKWHSELVELADGPLAEAQRRQRPPGLRLGRPREAAQPATCPRPSAAWTATRAAPAARPSPLVDVDGPHAGELEAGAPQVAERAGLVRARRLRGDHLAAERRGVGAAAGDQAWCAPRAAGVHGRPPRPEPAHPVLT